MTSLPSTNVADSTDPRLEQARRHVRHKEFADAIALFEQLLAEEPTCVAALEGLAAAQFLNGDLDGAVEAYTRITRLDVRNGKALINLGAVYNRQGEYAKAADAVRRGIQREKKSAQGYYNLGIAQKHLGQKSMAVNAYREAIRLDPQMVEAYLNLANLYLEMGSTSQAVDHYKKALEVNPEFERARHGLLAAESADGAARKAFSPFGRLVDTERTGAKGSAVCVRNLSQTERFEDRQGLHAKAVKATAATKAFLNHCRDELLPSLLALSRAVAQSTETPAAIVKYYDMFDAAVARNAVLRRELKWAVLEIRAHEELMNTPDLEP
ncbi:MAG: tetratricopeptide repeat protein [Planctomycetes bacterium]|nr:tetratricopeptide repeat protein [Planctomycetota bacterium]